MVSTFIFASSDKYRSQVGGADVFAIDTISVFVPEMGRVHRNCTEDGWSEPMPHYVDACIFYDNATKPV